jgi:hypothetical protein
MNRRQLFRLALASPAAWLVGKYGPHPATNVTTTLTGLEQGDRTSWIDIGSGSGSGNAADLFIEGSECISRKVGMLTPDIEARLQRAHDQAIWLEPGEQAGLMIETGDVEWEIEVHGPPFPPGVRG